MQRSNLYIIIFSAILTIILGGLLSLTSVGLKPLQDIQVELDTKKKILGAVMDISEIKDPAAILKLYDQRMKSIVVDFEGNLVKKDRKGNPIVAEKVNIQKNYKMDKEERFYPIYMLMDENDTMKVVSYVFPMFGNGLWDWISAYMALSNDLNTVVGIAFDHKTETPGLGARITSPEIQNRYKNKKVFGEGGKLESIYMVKGEGNEGLTDHQVDGMSGATMTGKGVNAMIEQYLACYQAYINKVKSGSQLALK